MPDMKRVRSRGTVLIVPGEDVGGAGTKVLLTTGLSPERSGVKASTNSKLKTHGNWYNIGIVP